MSRPMVAFTEPDRYSKYFYTGNNTKIKLLKGKPRGKVLNLHAMSKKSRSLNLELSMPKNLVTM